ncbi:NXPE family member 3-like [Salarias fasciatus]|uniref:NXPE family member 3-like n=1 Tax=Salarias fasciatus TaxID=181472 RepID=UPI001176F002|nr:NXPE family member 3-like [Salarias fasciatus]
MYTKIVPKDEVDPITTARVTSKHQRNLSFCSLQHLSPEEAVEENFILNSIAWPETPPLLPPRSINDTSDPAHSSFIILPNEGGGQWIIGDRLEVRITMFDHHGHSKKYGGDVLTARLHSPALDAGVAGQVLDHLNGTYSVVFPLLWEGSAQVEVTLVHPSEAVAVLHRLIYDQPDRIAYNALFRSGSVNETTICGICMRPTQHPLCDYTDVRTGEPWFCYKPKTLSCDHRITHTAGPVREATLLKSNLFQRGVNLKVFIGASGPAQVTVLSKKEDQPEAGSRSVSGAAGYYYKGVWQSLRDTPVHQFNTTSAITECLRHKEIHMYGDSTVRQWFEYLLKVQPDLHQFDLHNPAQSGPLLALDYKNNIKVTFRCHGPPIRFTVSSSEMRYIANELDGVAGGANTVIIFGIWAHYGTFPIEIYIRRLMTIRKAVLRLLARAPDTLVIIRTPNPKSSHGFEEFSASDWYSIQQDRVLRTIFKGINVHLVDAWEMTLAHWLPHNTHPEPPIIKNMMNVKLSYICSGNSN